MNFKHKIKNLDETIAAIGEFPRDVEVVMCHGTFDVVHPGHIRHLIYAREKGDLLIVSITCDAHITKDNLRPYVPQELRALNLAALEFVDIVIIDENPTPVENISAIRPNIFAKGYEYTSSGLPRKTENEKAAVEFYGGQMLFTPGDVVYSSSRIIESSAPNIKYEKLLSLLNGEGITFDDIRVAVKKISNFKVHVVGDTIVDTYTDTAMIGGQTKTPTISVRFQSKRRFVGGAAVVAKHLKAAGADVTFTTILGDDKLSSFVCEELADFGVEVKAIIDSSRPTTDKNAIVCNDYRLLKIDTLENRPISEAQIDEISDSIKCVEADCVVFSDFRHGIFNKDSTPRLIDAIPAGTYKVADSQVASRWGNIIEFQSFDLITPNEREARFSLGDQDSVIRPLALRLFKEANCKNLILKLGDRGLMGYRRTPKRENDVKAFFVVDSFARRVVDPVGSGDALLAYAALAELATGDTVISAVLGAFAAGLECEYDGNQPVSNQDLLKLVDEVEATIKYGG